MDAVFQTLKVLSVALYAVTFAAYLSFYLKGAKRSAEFTSPLLVISVLVHLIFLFVIALTHGHVPVTSLGEAMTTTAFCVAIIYYFIELSTREKNLGAFVLALTLLLQVVALFFTPKVKQVNPMLEDGGFAFHAVANILGYSGFFLGFVFSVLYLMLLRQIKRKQTGHLFQRLPSLGVLDTMSLHSITLGFALFSVGLTAGVLWAKKSWNVYFKFEPKLVMAFVTWFIYLGYLCMRKMPGWSRKKSAVVAVGAFVILIVSFMFASRFSSTHQF